MMDKKEKLLVLFLLLVFFIQCVESNKLKSITFDEPIHILSGINYFSEKIAINLEHPPLAKLWTGIPSFFIDSENTWVRIQKMLFYSRLQVTLIALLLGVSVFLFSKKLWGTKPAIISLFLFSFSPNIIAHSRLVTNDLICITLGFISVYFLYLAIHKKPIFYVFSMIFFALSANTRFSGFIYILPIIILLILNKKQISKQRIRTINLNWFKLLLGFLITTILITNIVYFIAFNEFSFTFVPKKLIEGLIIGFTHLKKGHPSFFLGKFSKNGNYLFFLIAFLIKTPITTIILFLTSVKIMIEKKEYSENYFLLLPIFLIFIIISLGSKINIGLRHVLGIYPFLFVFSGNSINYFLNNTNLKKILFGILILWYLLTAILIFPHHLEYFNELIGGPNNGYKYLIDSNLDWGQDKKYLEKYLEKNPKTINNPNCKKIKGTIILTANEYHGLLEKKFIPCELNKNKTFEYCGNQFQLNKNCYKWIKTKPIKFITPSILVFEVE